MTIQYASDLHLEFGANSNFISKNALVPVGEILILAGDIGILGNSHFLNHPIWQQLSDNFKDVIIIPGNHELYNAFDINELTENWQFEIRHNIKYVYNSVIQINSRTDLITSTLWSAIAPSDALITERHVNDFYHIRSGQKRLTWERFNEEHIRCRDFIKKSIFNSRAENIIVATHHVPSFSLMAEEFNGSRINGAFSSELNDLIAGSNVKFWIYGHSHRNICRKIGDTMCISNQLGYVAWGEQLTFDPAATIEIPD